MAKKRSRKISPGSKKPVGRPRIHPLDEQGRTMVRRTDVEGTAWENAAAAESADLGLPPGSELTVGPWLRRLANARARDLGAFDSNDARSVAASRK